MKLKVQSLQAPILLHRLYYVTSMGRTGVTNLNKHKSCNVEYMPVSYGDGSCIIPKYT